MGRNDGNMKKQRAKRVKRILLCFKARKALNPLLPSTLWGKNGVLS